MKRELLLVVLFGVMAQLLFAQTAVKDSNAVELFQLSDVEITGGAFRDIQEINHGYLLSFATKKIAVSPKLQEFYVEAVKCMFETTHDAALSDSLNNYLTRVKGVYPQRRAVPEISLEKMMLYPYDYADSVEIGQGISFATIADNLRRVEQLYCQNADIKNIEYYEDRLYNHILSSYDPDYGMCCDNLPLRPAAYKLYNTAYEGYSRNTGESMIFAARFAKMIYAHTADTLIVNIFIPSTLEWNERGFSMMQQTDFPNKAKTTFFITGSNNEPLTIRIRHPQWSISNIDNVWVNGVRQKLTPDEDGYISITRIWKDGDVISQNLTPAFSTISLGKESKYAAFMYGPILLAEIIDNHGLYYEDFYKHGRKSTLKQISLTEVPAVIGKLSYLSQHLSKLPGEEFLIRTDNDITTKQLELIPFYMVSFDRYATFLRHYDTQEQYDKEQQSGAITVNSLLH